MKTTVSVPVRIKVIREDGTAFSGLSVTQQWGVYGYGGSRGDETKITDRAGMVELPARHSTVTLGMRTLRRTGAFFTQCTTIPISGRFLSGYTDKWGPIVHINIQLPPGIWVPALPYHGFTSPYADDDDYNYSGGLHHYFELRNRDHNHPTAYIGGTAQIESADSTITLRLRPKPDEPKDRTELHNLLFKQASDLLQPYLILTDTKPKSTEDETSRNELETAISLFERVRGLNPSRAISRGLAVFC